MGNLGKDAEVRTLEGGTQVVSFNVAVSKKWTDRTGQKVEQTTWFSCSRFINPGQSWGVTPHLKKSTKVVVEGEISARAYMTGGGEAAASLELRVLDLHFAGGAPQANTQTAQPQAQPQAQAAQPKPEPTGNMHKPVYMPPTQTNEEMIDDLPF